MLKNKKIIIITLILIIIAVILFVAIKPLIFVMRDFDATLHDSITILSNLKNEDIIKVSEDEGTIIYITKSEDYQSRLEQILEDMQGEYIEQSGSYISFKNQSGEVKEIEWLYTKYYNKFVVYK